MSSIQINIKSLKEAIEKAEKMFPTAEVINFSPVKGYNEGDVMADSQSFNVFTPHTIGAGGIYTASVAYKIVTSGGDIEKNKVCLFNVI